MLDDIDLNIKFDELSDELSDFVSNNELDFYARGSDLLRDFYDLGMKAADIKSTEYIKDFQVKIRELADEAEDSARKARQNLQNAIKSEVKGKQAVSFGLEKMAAFFDQRANSLRSVSEGFLAGALSDISEKRTLLEKALATSISHENRQAFKRIGSLIGKLGGILFDALNLIEAIETGRYDKAAGIIVGTLVALAFGKALGVFVGGAAASTMVAGGTAIVVAGVGLVIDDLIVWGIGEEIGTEEFNANADELINKMLVSFGDFLERMIEPDVITLDKTEDTLEILEGFSGEAFYGTEANVSDHFSIGSIVLNRARGDTTLIDLSNLNELSEIRTEKDGNKYGFKYLLQETEEGVDLVIEYRLIDGFGDYIGRNNSIILKNWDQESNDYGVGFSNVSFESALAAIASAQDAEKRSITYSKDHKQIYNRELGIFVVIQRDVLGVVKVVFETTYSAGFLRGDLADNWEAFSDLLFAELNQFEAGTHFEFMGSHGGGYLAELAFNEAYNNSPAVDLLGNKNYSLTTFNALGAGSALLNNADLLDLFPVVESDLPVVPPNIKRFVTCDALAPRIDRAGLDLENTYVLDGVSDGGSFALTNSIEYIQRLVNAGQITFTKLSDVELLAESFSLDLIDASAVQAVMGHLTSGGAFRDGGQAEAGPRFIQMILAIWAGKAGFAEKLEFSHHESDWAKLADWVVNNVVTHIDADEATKTYWSSFIRGETVDLNRLRLILWGADSTIFGTANSTYSNEDGYTSLLTAKSNEPEQIQVAAQKFLMDHVNQALVDYPAITQIFRDTELFSVEEDVSVVDPEATADDPVGANSGEEVVGTESDDILQGNSSDETLSGAAGSDSVFGYGGNDSLSGGDGDDALYGGSGRDRLYGNADNDTLHGGAGDDFLDGGTAMTVSTLEPAAIPLPLVMVMTQSTSAVKIGISLFMPAVTVLTELSLR